ncbi:hypothetical protein GA0115234_103312 [Streptomyces sp. DvalAA-43]|nr:hypothetical protein GA0115234_103312 [Streptomyces sp. DvalAA-43]
MRGRAQLDAQHGRGLTRSATIRYIRYGPGTWSGGEDVIDVYEVPTEDPAAL